MIASPRRIKGSSFAVESNRGAAHSDSVALVDVFGSDCIVRISSTTKADAIRCLVSVLVNNHRVDASRAEEIIRNLMRRESYGSSAFGNGFAFPHLRTSEVQRFTGAIGVAPEGLSFESLDHRPTKLVFLTLSPIASREQHMNLLSRMFNLMRDKAISMQLHHCIQPIEIYRYLQDLDDQSEFPIENIASMRENTTND